MAEFVSITDVTRRNLCDSPNISVVLQQPTTHKQHCLVDDKVLTFTVTLDMTAAEMYGADVMTQVEGKSYKVSSLADLLSVLKPKGHRLWAKAGTPVTYLPGSDGSSLMTVKFWRVDTLREGNMASHLDWANSAILMGEVEKKLTDQYKRVTFNMLRCIELIEQDKKEKRSPITADDVADILKWGTALTPIIKELSGMKKVTANTFMKWLES